MSKTGTIYGINGPVIYLAGNTGFKMSEMVYVGKEKLVGEVISLDKDRTTIQVYEETSGSPVIRWLFCSRCISRRTPLVISIASSTINAMFIMLVTKPSPFSLSISSTASMNNTIVFRLRAARAGSFLHYYSNACAL